MFQKKFWRLNIKKIDIQRYRLLTFLYNIKTGNNLLILWEYIWNMTLFDFCYLEYLKNVKLKKIF